MKLYSTKEFAEKAGVTTRTLMNWRKSGRLIPQTVSETSETFGPRLVKKYSEEQLRLVKATETLVKAKIEEIIQNQRRLGELKLPNDSLSHKIIKFDAEEYAEIIGDSEPCTVNECPLKDKSGKPLLDQYGKTIFVRTKYWLNHIEGFDDMTPLRQFDLLVVAVYSAAVEQCWDVITINQFCDTLTGGESRVRDMLTFKETVINSIKRLMGTIITVDMTETCKRMKYKTDKPRRTAPILPCELQENIKVNGQKTTVVKIYAESPLMEIAEVKNQILRINTELLKIPFNRSPRAIKIEGYIVSWVETIVRHKNINANIKLDNIYEYAEVDEADRSAKRNVRNAIEATLNHLKEKGRINNWIYTMLDSQGRVAPYKSGNTLYGIQILR